MTLKNLNKYQHFDAEAFFSNLTLAFLKEEPNYIYENGQRTDRTEGIKAIVVITNDTTQENDFEKLTIKLKNKSGLGLPRGTKVKVLNPEARIYGDFRNQLSIVADDILAVSVKNDKP